MTLRHRALIIVALIILLATVGLVSCSPGKRMLRNQDALAELAKRQAEHDNNIAAAAVNEFVKANPCNPVPEINLDSLCGLYYRCPDVSQNTPADDYTAADHGPAIVTTGGKPPRRVLVPYKDTRKEKLLEDSITEKNKRLAVLEAQIKTKDAECRDLLAKAHGDAKKNKKTLLWIIALLSLFVIGFFVATAIKKT